MGALAQRTGCRDGATGGDKYAVDAAAAATDAAVAAADTAVGALPREEDGETGCGLVGAHPAAADWDDRHGAAAPPL